MKKLIRAIATIAIMGIMLVCAYLLGTTQAETITEIQTVTETRDVEKVIEVIPDGYIDTESPDFQENYIDMRMVIDFKSNEDGLQLYFADGTGYWIKI